MESKFSITADSVKGAVQSFIMVTNPEERHLENKQDSDSLAREIHDLDYICGHMQAFGVLARLERERKYIAYTEARKREGNPVQP